METTNTNGAVASSSHQKLNETPIQILIKDIESSLNLYSEEEKSVLQKLLTVLKNNYLNKERIAMTNFAFKFYHNLSIEKGVPENLISENLTLAEVYFDKTFNSK
jgi:hypothetical protein